MKPSVARELAVGHCPTASFLATGGSNFPNACMVYKHAVAAAFHIYAQGDEVPAKRVGWRPCIK